MPQTGHAWTPISYENPNCSQCGERRTEHPYVSLGYESTLDKEKKEADLLSRIAALEERVSALEVKMR